MPGTVLLQARGLTKIYDDGAVGLRALEMTVCEGEAVALLGANGAGKTTTINLFLGFLRPTDGAALVGGIGAWEEPQRARDLLGYLPETVGLYPRLTAWENVRFFVELSGRRASREAAEEMLDLVGLEPEALDRRTAVLSKGMRQKVAIMIAALRDARVLLLDEPSSGLDPVAAAQLEVLIERMRARGCAILMSTHDLFRARAVCDRALILRNGTLAGLVEDLEALTPIVLESLYHSVMDYARDDERPRRVRSAPQPHEQVIIGG